MSKTKPHSNYKNFTEHTPSVLVDCIHACHQLQQVAIVVSSQHCDRHYQYISTAICFQAKVKQSAHVMQSHAHNISGNALSAYYL